MSKLTKSPLNYIGGKYRLLPQLLPLFPARIDTFLDLFAGGLDVSLNVKARRIVANDINHYLTGMLQYFKEHDMIEVIDEVHAVIDRFQLSKANAEGYAMLRNEYNRAPSPILLFALVCFGFNHQFRFNSAGEFNNPFGRNRSSYNANTERNLRAMLPLLRGITFTSVNFRNYDITGLGHGDLIYADPPYLITCGSYNDGKRGFEGWTAADDLSLFALLDEADRRGVRFALSNVTRHKNLVNQPLIDWAARYNVHNLMANYDNSNYQARHSETQEVLITNY